MNYYDEIKNEIIDIEVFKMVKDYSKNKRELEGCYKIGQLLDEASKVYGEGIIDEYSKRLDEEFKDGVIPPECREMLGSFDKIVIDKSQVNNFKNEDIE